MAPKRKDGPPSKRRRILVAPKSSSNNSAMDIRLSGTKMSAQSDTSYTFVGEIIKHLSHAIQQRVNSVLAAAFPGFPRLSSTVRKLPPTPLTKNVKSSAKLNIDQNIYVAMSQPTLRPTITIPRLPKRSTGVVLPNRRQTSHSNSALTAQYNIFMTSSVQQSKEHNPSSFDLTPSEPSLDQTELKTSMTSPVLNVKSEKLYGENTTELQPVSAVEMSDRTTQTEIKPDKIPRFTTELHLGLGTAETVDCPTQTETKTTEFSPLHYKMVDVRVVVVLPYNSKSANHLTLKAGQVLKQKIAPDENGMAYGWIRKAFFRKQYGFYPAANVQLVLNKEKTKKQCRFPITL